jgi:small subunit ribosomal protein S20
LANTLSAEKRARQAIKHAERNRWYRTRARTFVKRARLNMTLGQVPEAEDAIRRARQALDVAAQKGAIHPNNASRRKSRLMQAFNRMETKASS